MGGLVYACLLGLVKIHLRRPHIQTELVLVRAKHSPILGGARESATAMPFFVNATDEQRVANNDTSRRLARRGACIAIEAARTLSNAASI